MAGAESIPLTLTGALEDYLETILLLVRDQGFARVRDIAKARNVKSSSVTPALRRLDELGLVKYVQREYVGLTAAGEQQARRVLARHDILCRFFKEILQMPSAAASREACAIEHSLSTDGMDRLVRFFEFMCVCPENQREWLERFHSCALVQEDVPMCEHINSDGNSVHNQSTGTTPMTVLSLKPGQEGKVRQVRARGSVRQQLLDMGLLPQVVIRMERVTPTGDRLWISLEGSSIELRRKEAETVLIAEG